MGEMIQFDEHIFQVGWFNHQPEECDPISEFLNLQWFDFLTSSWKSILYAQQRRIKFRDLARVSSPAVSHPVKNPFPSVKSRIMPGEGNVCCPRTGKIPMSFLVFFFSNSKFLDVFFKAHLWIQTIHNNYWISSFQKKNPPAKTLSSFRGGFFLVNPWVLDVHPDITRRFFSGISHKLGLTRYSNLFLLCGTVESLNHLPGIGSRIAGTYLLCHCTSSLYNPRSL